MESSVRVETWLWLAQRISAAVLAVCIAVHIATMIIAMQGGLSTAEIAGRVAGNPVWLAFYGVFLGAVTVHAPIGIRTVLLETTSLSENRVRLLTMLMGLFVAVLGVRTIYGLFQMGAGT